MRRNDHGIQQALQTCGSRVNSTFTPTPRPNANIDVLADRRFCAGFKMWAMRVWCRKQCSRNRVVVDRRALREQGVHSALCRLFESAQHLCLPSLAAPRSHRRLQPSLIPSPLRNLVVLPEKPVSLPPYHHPSTHWNSPPNHYSIPPPAPPRLSNCSLPRARHPPTP